MSIFKTELNKSICNIGFIGAVLLTCILCFTSEAYVDGDTGKAFTVFEAMTSIDRSIIESNYEFASIILFMKSIGGYISMFIPIIVAFPYMITCCTEKTSGNYRILIHRSKIIKYNGIKFLTAMFTGGLAFMLGIILYGIVVSVVFPALSFYNIDNETTNMILPSPEIYTAIKIIAAAFLYGAVSAIPAVFLSSFCYNPYIITCTPFMLTYIWNTGINKIANHAMQTNNIELIKTIQPFYPYSITYFIFTTANYEKTLLFNIMYSVFFFIGFMVIIKNKTDKGA